MPQNIIDQIIRAIADVEGVDPVHLELPLENYVSTDAIRSLVNHESDAWHLQFKTADHIVEVTGKDEILVDGRQTRTLY